MDLKKLEKIFSGFPKNNWRKDNFCTKWGVNAGWYLTELLALIHKEAEEENEEVEKWEEDEGYKT